MTPILENLRKLSQKRKEQEDKALSTAERIKLAAEAAKKAALEAQSEKE